MEYKIDHIGYLTENITESRVVMESLGYKWEGEVFDDDIQHCKICFLQKSGEARIELVEPYEDNKTMQKMLKKQGNGPYHTCYMVDDIDKVFAVMKADGWYAMFDPVDAVAFNNKKISYLFKDEVGYIEIVEK